MVTEMVTPTSRESLKIALPCHALGSHGWLQVRLGGLHSRMRSADSAEKNHGSCEKGLREEMGEMSPVQERDNLWKATGEKDYNILATVV